MVNLEFSAFNGYLCEITVVDFLIDVKQLTMKGTWVDPKVMSL